MGVDTSRIDAARETLADLMAGTDVSQIEWNAYAAARAFLSDVLLRRITAVPRLGVFVVGPVIMRAFSWLQ